MSIAKGRGARIAALAVNPKGKWRTLLVGCALVSQYAIAHPFGEPLLFHAARLPAAGAEVAVGGTGPVAMEGMEEGAREVSSFAAFIPLPDADRIRAQIDSLEARGDYYSPRLAELSEQLGRVLQAEGDHRAALAAFDRSFHVNRRHEGLRSPMQAALLRAQIESHVALGDVDAADLLQQSLFSMQQALLTEQPVALADAYREAADWNMQYYLRQQETYVPGGATELEHRARAERLAEALGHYHRALALLSTVEEGRVHDDKAVLERRIAAVTLIADRQYQRNAPVALTKPALASLHQTRRSHNPVFFEHGSAALQRAAAYAEHAEPVEHALRLFELADWYLLMDQYDRARDTYATALQTLRAADVPEQRIAELLDAGLPVRDPERELRELALAAADALGSDGYIDVAFDLDRFGKARNPRILASAGDDAAVENALLRQIHASRFRPAFVDGVPVGRDDVTLRYYFTR